MTTVEPIKNKKDVERVERYIEKQSDKDHLLFIFGTNSGLRISDIVAFYFIWITKYPISNAIFCNDKYKHVAN